MYEEEEDTCMPQNKYCMNLQCARNNEEEDTCMYQEEEDTCTYCVWQLLPLTYIVKWSQVE